MGQLAVAENEYQQLVKKIKQEISAGLVRAQKELEYQKLFVYWRLGRSIEKNFLKGRDRPGHGTALYERLSTDLGIAAWTIALTVRIYRFYPKVPKKDGLNFSHYAMLIRIKDPRKRRNLRERILKEHLTNTDLRRLIPDLRHTPFSKVSGNKLSVQRGKLYHYRTREIKDVHTSQADIEIDCGFDIAIEKTPLTEAALSRGKIVVSIKEDSGYRIAQPKPQPQRDVIYTYQAYVERVVDADTLVVKIDVGFGIFIRQRLRLKAIDAPEMTSFSGREAKRYVEKTLNKVKFVVIKTYGSDKFDRYLVDVFYLPRESNPHRVAREGRFLNQELLDAGLAKVYDG